jgi:5-methylcytosine-specific restriction endonuclease McrA
MKYYLNQVFKKYSKNEKSPSRATVRRRVLETNAIPYVCAGCGNKGYWNGGELTLELHHIDRNRYNNELKNLTFMCPNCHVEVHKKERKK